MKFFFFFWPELIMGLVAQTANTNNSMGPNDLNLP